MRTSVPLNQGEMAALAGVTRQTISDWMVEGLPHTKPGGREVVYDLFTAIPWIRDNKWKPSLDDRSRKLKAEADLAEMERDLQAGKLVDAAEVEASWVDAAIRVRAKILGMPPKLAPQVVSMTIPEAQELIERECHQALAELSTTSGEED